MQTRNQVRTNGSTAASRSQSQSPETNSALSPAALQLPYNDADMAAFFRQMDVLDRNIDKMRYLNESMLNSLNQWRQDGFPVESLANDFANGFHLLREELETSFEEHHAATRALFAKFSPVLTRELENQLDTERAAMPAKAA